MFTLTQIAQITNGKIYNEHQNVKIEHVHFDSRKITNNSLFIALTSGSTDGHMYIDSAIESGASCLLLSNKNFLGTSKIPCVLVEDTEKALQLLAKEYRKILNIPVIGITGSNGKTTTKDMAASVLSSKFNVHKTEGNYNNHLGLPITILQARKEHEIMILEMGMSHKGEIELLSSIAKPDYSIITNIGESHIENLGSKEGIALAKSEILLHTNINGCAFLPNNEFFNLMSSHYNGEIISFGEFPDSDLFFEDSKILNNTTNFLFYSKSSLSPIEFNLSIHGNHNILNSLSVISLSLKLGVSVENIQHSLSNLSITKMRFETTTHPSGCILINDTYNASPSSMKASIHTFIEAYGSKQKVVVLSDMLELGDFSEEFHREIGSFLKNKDVSLFTIGKFSKFISEEGNGTHFPSTDELNNFLQKFLDKDTAIFFKASRGMKLEKTVLSLV